MNNLPQYTQKKTQAFWDGHDDRDGIEAGILALHPELPIKVHTRQIKRIPEYEDTNEYPCLKDTEVWN